MNTFVGIFDNARDAQRGVAMLQDSSLQLDDVSVISREGDHDVAVSSAEDVTASQGATVGAVWGGIVGLASLVIPGVGPFIAGGALAAALAGAATGAVTGAVVGGVSAALIHFGGIPEDEAHRYESLVYEGKTLVAGKARPEDMRHVRRMLTKAGGETVENATTGATAATSSVQAAPDTTTGITTVAPSSGVVTIYDEQGQQVEYGADDSDADVVSTPPSA